MALHCEACGLSFVPARASKGAGEPTVCGRVYCRSVKAWGPDEWAGQRRMANARLAAGRILVLGGFDAEGRRLQVWSTDVLSPLDRAALAREV